MRKNIRKRSREDTQRLKRKKTYTDTQRDTEREEEEWRETFVSSSKGILACGHSYHTQSQLATSSVSDKKTRANENLIPGSRERQRRGTTTPAESGAQNNREGANMSAQHKYQVESRRDRWEQV